MATELKNTISGIETSFNACDRDLKSLQEKKEQFIVKNNAETKKTILGALSQTGCLVKMLQTADLNLLECETQSQLLLCMSSGKTDTSVSLDSVKQSWDQAVEKASSTLTNAMNLGVEVSDFYGSRVVALDRDTTKATADIEESLKIANEDLGKTRAATAAVERDLVSERARCWEARSELEYYKETSKDLGKSALAGGVVTFFSVAIGVLCPPLAPAAVVIGSCSLGGTIGVGAVTAVSTGITLVKDSKVDGIQSRLNVLNSKLDANSKRSTTLDSDKSTYAHLKIRTTSLQVTARTLRDQTVEVQKQLTAAKDQMSITLIRTRRCQSQIEWMSYLDTREEVLELLDFVVKTAGQEKLRLGLDSAEGMRLLHALEEDVRVSRGRTPKIKGFTPLQGFTPLERGAPLAQRTLSDACVLLGVILVLGMCLIAALTGTTSVVGRFR